MCRETTVFFFFFSSIQLHDAARRLYFFAANRFYYAANCSETTVHHLGTQQLVSISSSSSSSSCCCCCYYYYFRNCKSCVYNCDDLLSYNSSPRSSHTWFSYFVTSSASFHGFIKNQFNNLLPVGLLAQWVRALHRSRLAVVKGSNPVQVSLFFSFFFFFRLSFRSCKSCVYNFDDLLSYNSFTPQFTYFHTFIT